MKTDAPKWKKIAWSLSTAVRLAMWFACDIVSLLPSRTILTGKNPIVSLHPRDVSELSSLVQQVRELSSKFAYVTHDIHHPANSRQGSIDVRVSAGSFFNDAMTEMKLLSQTFGSHAGYRFVVFYIYSILQIYIYFSITFVATVETTRHSCSCLANISPTQLQHLQIIFFKY